MKYRFEIKIDTDNAAFGDGNLFGEISRILGEVSEGMAEGFTPEKLKDVNGNTVGSVQFVEVGE
jgi:hypothetical protein